MQTLKIRCIDGDTGGTYRQIVPAWRRQSVENIFRRTSFGFSLLFFTNDLGSYEFGLLYVTKVIYNEVIKITLAYASIFPSIDGSCYLSILI